MESPLLLLLFYPLPLHPPPPPLLLLLLVISSHQKGRIELGRYGRVLDGSSTFLCSLWALLKLLGPVVAPVGGVAFVLVRIDSPGARMDGIPPRQAHQISEKFGFRRLSSLLSGSSSASVL